MCVTVGTWPASMVHYNAAASFQYRPQAIIAAEIISLFVHAIIRLRRSAWSASGDDWSKALGAAAVAMAKLSTSIWNWILSPGRFAIPGLKNHGGAAFAGG